MSETTIEIEVIDSLERLSQTDWDSCACPETNGDGIDDNVEDRAPRDPFTTYRFLRALEVSGSVGEGTGWMPRYIVARASGQIIACAPMYVKSNSQGEYIFDHNWAHAYENAGGRYYPKLQIAAPFTPATGRRFLTRPGWEDAGMSALTQGAVRIAAENQLSSLHITFCTAAEAEAGEKMGLMRRTSQQFQWENPGYVDWEGFLSCLSSRKRKNIRKERARAQAFGGTIHAFQGDEIEPEHWDAFWAFYQDTGARKWGRPYLTRAFFDEAQAHLRDDILLVLAKREGRWIAGALNFIGRDTIFGRYWGCLEDHPCLHFELCYYQAIDYAIANGLRVEAGAQGEHKLARGYMPAQTHSLHWFSDAGFRDAVANYLEAERNAVDEDIEILTAYGPFKSMTGDLE